jgi:hypothetical protein
MTVAREAPMKRERVVRAEKCIMKDMDTRDCVFEWILG